MGIVKGELRILHIKRQSGDWQQVAHLTVNSLSTQTNFLPTTARKNNGFATEIPISNQSTIDFSAILFDDADVGLKAGYKILKEIQQNRELIEWKLEALTANLNDYGSGYIGSLNEDSPVDSYITYDGSINVYGRIITIEDNSPPSTPTLNSATSEYLSSYVLLKWTESVDDFAVVGYEILKNGETITVGVTQEYQDYDIIWGEFYNYNVRAFDAAGNYSAWSNKRFLTVPIPSGMSMPSYILEENGEPLFTENLGALIEE